MDSADLAQAQEEALRTAALAQRVKPGQAPAAWYCEDCLVAIPEARRLAVPACTRCVECQARVEAGGRP